MTYLQPHKGIILPSDYMIITLVQKNVPNAYEGIRWGIGGFEEKALIWCSVLLETYPILAKSAYHEYFKHLTTKLSLG